MRKEKKKRKRKRKRAGVNKFQACQKKPGSAIQLLCTSDFINFLLRIRLSKRQNREKRKKKIKNALNKTANHICNSNSNKYGDNSFKGERGSDAKIGDEIFSSPSYVHISVR